MGIRIELKGEKHWLEARENVVTATEASALFGLNPYMSARKMLANKLQPEFMENSFVIVGRLLESVVVEATNLFANFNFELYDEEDVKIFYKHDTLRLGATPDAHENNKIILECKTTSPKRFEDWEDGNVPHNYAIQVYTQMMCTGIKEAYISCMSTNLAPLGPTHPFPLIIFKVHYNQEIVDLLSEEVNRFWECVYAGEEYTYKRKNNKLMKELLATSLERTY